MPDQVRHDRIQNLVSTVSVVVGLIDSRILQALEQIERLLRGGPIMDDGV